MKRIFSSAAAAATGTRRRWMEKISARVFCQNEDESPHSDDGATRQTGNPITLFVPMEDDDDEPPLSMATQKRLAQSCSWESVVINHHRQQQADDKKQKNKVLSFFLPTGQEVSFCAHAAMAGAIRVATELDQPVPLLLNMLMQDEAMKNMTTQATVHEDDIVSLTVHDAPYAYDKVTIDNPALLYRLLRSSCNLQVLDLPHTKQTRQYPTFCHVSVAGRTKTLIYVKNAATLYDTCQAPEQPQVFARACQNLNTTGLFLYTEHPDLDGHYVCRQFPANSGYPEDPATGLAAAAAAASMMNELPVYKFHQGPSLAESSLILVEDVGLFELENENENEKAAATEEPPAPPAPPKPDPEQEERKRQREMANAQDHDGNFATMIRGPRQLEKEKEYNENEAEPYTPLEEEEEVPSHRATINFQLLGKMEIDSTEEIAIDDEEQEANNKELP